ncbi:glycerophosphodiester phosphodiesterase [Herbaspirillum lusitanum]|jgi:glycerophosphoryl diester phosphodiesterase|uniref:Glycerophosphodiester phosphodiesterase n=1 Tax=Herbaspirillum lusitanum TaxID=213312 RepID=A0ABW9A3M1_9BURK
MWPYPKIVAHRGGGILAPENTIAGFKAGLEHGFKAVEFDVMLTRDEVPILMHDPQRGRTLPGSGRIAEQDWAELRELDAGGWHGPDFVGERICTLQAALDFCVERGIWMNIEIKPAAPEYARRTGELTAALVRAKFSTQLAAHAAPAQLPLFSSFSFDALMAAKVGAPDIPRGFLIDAPGPDWRERLQQLAAVALHTNHKHLSAGLAQAVKQAGYGLFCYTVNEAQRAREILGWGVDAFCTDRIDLIGPGWQP